jgi:hypothetical protein
MKKKYRSKYGFIVPFIAIFWLLIIVFSFICEWIYLLPGFMAIFITITTHYIIDNETLILKNGFFFSVAKVDIKTIKKIKETKNRIEIHCKKYGTMMLYPKDKQAFINDLKSINSEIEVIYRKKK